MAKLGLDFNLAFIGLAVLLLAFIAFFIKSCSWLLVR
jgi:hypothetical protein